MPVNLGYYRYVITLICVTFIPALFFSGCVGGDDRYFSAWPIHTKNRQASQLVERALEMLYSFDVGEARADFQKALELDPSIVLAYWGLAQAETTDVNAVYTRASERRGRRAALEAQKHLKDASPEEGALIRAMMIRFGKGSLTSRLIGSATYLSTWTRAHRVYSNVLVVTAYAIFNERLPLVSNGRLTPRASELLKDLNTAIARDPANIGARHLRIHFYESIGSPAYAVDDATDLASRSYPAGESHLLHMPAHVWGRTGDYARLISDSERAISNERVWFASGHGPGQRYMQRYRHHEVEFALYGLTTTGRSIEAETLSRGEDPLAITDLELRLHNYRKALEYSPRQAHFERAIAAARLGRYELSLSEERKLISATETQQRLLAAAEAQQDCDIVALRARGVRLTLDLRVQRDLIEAARADKSSLLISVAKLQDAYKLMQHRYPGDPKDYWFTPVGEALGAALMRQNRNEEAEIVFSAQLRIFPNDPRLAWGLARAQERNGERSFQAQALYQANWRGAAALSLSDLE